MYYQCKPVTVSFTNVDVRKGNYFIRIDLSFNTLLMTASAMCIPIKQRESDFHAMMQE